MFEKIKILFPGDFKRMQAWNFISKRARPFSFCKGHFHKPLSNLYHAVTIFVMFPYSNNSNEWPHRDKSLLEKFKVYRKF